MKNIRLDIEYDGSPYHGWQRQTGHPTIQAFIEDNLGDVLGRKVVIYGASRTDSGVHAAGQVANFWSDKELPEVKWRDLLNDRLPRTIRITRSSEVAPTFHAQKLAVAKIYEYRVLNRDYSSALDRRVHFMPRPLDWEAVRAALPHFVGEMDFRSFQGAKATVVSTVRTIHSFALYEDYPGLFRFRIEGSGFLKQMVRAIVGTLFEVGEGKRRPVSIPEVIRRRDRDAAGRTAPASGLCLLRVKYET